MKIKEISVNVSKKIGLPNYSSVMLSASVTIEVKEEDASKAFKQAWQKCWKEVEEQEKEMKSKNDQDPKWIKKPNDYYEKHISKLEF